MDQNLNFLPINKAHAIVECTIFIEFLPVFTHAVRQKLVNLASRFTEKLPKSDVQKVVEQSVTMTPQGPQVSFKEELSGVELQRVKPDGNLEWMLRTTENIISVHCLDYTRWNKVWPQAKYYLDAAFEQIQGSESFVNAIGIKYIDRFVYQGQTQEYKISELFTEDSPLLANHLFKSGPLWHSHIGWFEEVEGIDDLSCLNQVNIDATFANFSGLKKPVTTIEHNAILRTGQNKSDISFFTQNENPENSKFDQYMFILHNINKKVLSLLLNNDIKTRINLGDVDV